ncbi:MAG: Hsp20/alpha crystallin family protein [Deltaproteobacteria bacterium]|nr:Hsp20/alpha crystallin family protein [Deltaproteobacteria bacterium]
MAEQELQVKAKAEAPAKAERVRPGRVFLPAVDIFETPEALVLVADMPGVAADKVTVDLRDNHLVISGEVAPPIGGGETMVQQEYYTGDFQREFHVGSLIDQGKIEASMKDGVLHLVLPKVEKAKPRKIEVKTA